MSGWILVEDLKRGSVEVINLDKVANIHTVGRTPRVRVHSQDLTLLTEIQFKDWKEFEKFLLMLPSVDQLGWLHVRDGKVLGAWRGSLRVLEEKARGEAKELTPEEESEVLEGGELPEPETGCWDEDAGEFRQPCP